MATNLPPLGSKGSYPAKVSKVVKAENYHQESLNVFVCVLHLEGWVIDLRFKVWRGSKLNLAHRFKRTKKTQKKLWLFLVKCV